MDASEIARGMKCIPRSTRKSSMVGVPGAYTGAWT